MNVTTEPAWVGSSTRALVAKQGDEPELTLFWFEETKQAMGFDPDAEPQVPLVTLDWAMWEQHPISLDEFMRSLAARAAPDNPTDFLYKQAELTDFIKRMERESDPEGQREARPFRDPDGDAGVSDHGGASQDGDVLAVQGGSDGQ